MTEPPQDSPPPAEETTASSASRSRRRRLPKEPTQDELDALPVEKRLELINQRRQSRHQTLNSVGILFGVVFTAASLAATALSVRTTQNELRNSQQGQITDRYTKAVDQIGSTKLDIRLGGIYALERLAIDSPRDDRTVYDVLCAYVREHDPPPGAKTPNDPATDIIAALTVIGRRKPQGDSFIPDLNNIRTPNINLSNANLADAFLNRADLTGAFLIDADLTDALLVDANLTRANLTNANLTNAFLAGANLAGADLRNVKGMTPDEIRKQAHTDSRTRF